MNEPQQPFDDDQFIPVEYTELIRQSYAEQGGYSMPAIDKTALMVNRALAVSVSDDLVKEYHDDDTVDDNFVRIFVRQTIDYGYILTDEAPREWTADNLFQAMGMTLGYLEVAPEFAGMLINLLESITKNLVARGLMPADFFTPDVRAWLMETVPQYLEDLDESMDEPMDESEIEVMERLMDDLGLEISPEDLMETNVDVAQDTSVDDDDLRVKFFFEVLNASGIPDLYQQHRSIKPAVKKHLAYLGTHQELLVLTVMYASAMREWLETQIEMGDWSHTDFVVRDFFDDVNGMFLQDVITIENDAEVIHYTAELKALISGVLAQEPEPMAYVAEQVLSELPAAENLQRGFITALRDRDQLTGEGLDVAESILKIVLDTIAVKTDADIATLPVEAATQVLIEKFHTFDLFGLDGFEFVDDVIIEFVRWLAERGLVSDAVVDRWGNAIEAAQLPRYMYALVADVQDYLHLNEVGQTVSPIY
ncbi:hypothetical protein [Weissella cibaria]|uniref:hypothetical protein n=1 Tax=Weissella cibaria TaxID=137591 RepID=UPI0011976A8C|nr:hypothetical protein [Weissella cibaria]TVV32007.1 hypothetical protein FO434_07050 [Weissella cibaria]